MVKPSKIHFMARKKMFNKIRICTQIDAELVSKVDVIASRSGLSRSSIYNKGVSMAVEVYEEKYGKIEIESPVKTDIDELFNHQ